MGSIASSQSASAPAGELLSPKAGEQWSEGSQHYILWPVAKGEANAVSIETAADTGDTWRPIAAAAPNSGQFLWQVTGPATAKCRVRVSRLGSGSVIGVAEFQITPSQEAKGYRWVNVTGNAPFAPRDGAGALTFKGRMWLLGGWNPGDKTHFPKVCNNEVWSSTDGNTWILEKPNTFLAGKFDANADWEGRHTAGCAVLDDKMWIVGGDPIQGHYQNDVWNSFDGRTWTLVNKDKPVPWGPRVLHYTLAFGGKLWIMGGQTLPPYAPEEERFFDDIWNSSDGVAWQQVKPVGPHWCPRGMIGGSVVFKDRMWVLGGGTYDTPKVRRRNFYNDVWSSPDGERWQQHLAMAPWTPRQYHDVAVFDGRMWVLEGWNQGNRKDVWYSSDGVNWYELPDTPWLPRHAASVFVHDNALWMIAGNNMTPDVWKLAAAK